MLDSSFVFGSGNNSWLQQYTIREMVQFMDNYHGDLHYTGYEGMVHMAKVDLLQKVQAIIKETVAEPVRLIDGDMFIGKTFVLTVNFGGGSRQLPISELLKTSASFALMGDLNVILRLERVLRDNFEPQKKQPRLYWDLLLGTQRMIRQMPIDEPDPLYAELCPWIGGDPKQYFDDYMASNEPVLILLGATGTGKTSFIRSLIWHKTLCARITYDEVLLASDALFFEFLVDSSTDLLVVEDADVLLKDRATAGNKVMSRFLNVTNGLIGVNKKKIIFTANIMEPSEIDEALMRDGRCFDCQVFRKLTYEEAGVAAAAIGIPQPPERTSYSIADLIATTKKRRRSPVEKVGFRR